MLGAFPTRRYPEPTYGPVSAGAPLADRPAPRCSRHEAVVHLVESVGGTVESLYYAFGPTSIYAIVDLPDHASAAALSLITNGSGRVAVETVVLMPPEEIDAAAAKTPDYRPPGT